jgi:hypothetical protein
METVATNLPDLVRLAVSMASLREELRGEVMQVSKELLRYLGCEEGDAGHHSNFTPYAANAGSREMSRRSSSIACAMMRRSNGS